MADLWFFGLPAAVKLFLIIMTATALVGTVRLAKVWFRLYRYVGARSIRVEDISRGNTDADRLAAFALGCRSIHKSLSKGVYQQAGIPADGDQSETVASLLRRAQNRVEFLCDECATELRFSKRACLLVLLLSVQMVGWGAYPTWRLLCYSPGPALDCRIQTARNLLLVFSYGLSLCFILYSQLSLLHGALSRRKSSWGYFCSVLRNS